MDLEKRQEKGELAEEEMEKLNKDLVGKLLLISWKGTRFESGAILRQVADNVLSKESASVTDEVVMKRAKALLLIGMIFKEVEPDETDEERRELERQSAKAALAIVRVDGPQADRLAQLIAPPKNNHITILEPRRVYRRKLISPFANDHQIIDPEAVLIRFHHPNHAASTIEFHLHGSTAVLKALLNTLSKLDFLRLAQPGEFTRRRFLRANGSMDINKVLGLKHLIDAETEEQRKWAVAEFNANLREKLKMAMALCEAVIDFSEDGFMDDQEIWNQGKQLGIIIIMLLFLNLSRTLTVIAHLELLKSTIIDHLSHSKRREKISAGIAVSLYGSPNVGKSTLLNHLAAIVSPYPGTTRDIIQVSIDFLEEIGIARAKENVRKADVRLLLVSAIEDHNSLHVVEEEESEAPPPTMILVTKTDLIDQSRSSDQLDQLVQNLKRRFPDVPIHPISVLHYNNNKLHGMSQFLQSFENHLKSLYGSEGISEQRSFQLTAYQTIYLEKILGHIEAFLGRLKTHLGSSSDGQRPDEDEDVDLVILIEELRLASGLLAKLSFSSPASSSETSSLTHPHYHPNEISTDEILGEIMRFLGFQSW
ncbi:tRNA modification GTPase TrmE [Puccinia sorghi]|uniref:tRNA modification GTPase TrmE n=1 Tax=Puccinia sorghi TaxID=27349 RepID=A0A0L6VBD6_9BASI|nr:tRNA modification GTPase TrmE [Puccinia sorghi]